jgi:hypothetical protein
MVDDAGRVNLKDYLTLQQSVDQNKNDAREFYVGLQQRFNQEIGLKIAQAQILVAKINEYQTAKGITDQVMNQLVTEAGGLFQEYRRLKEQEDLPTGPSLRDVARDIATRELMETLGYGQ